MAYEQFNIEVHLQDMLMHNGQLADPTNRYAKAMKEVSGKRKKTDADFQRLADLEFEGGLYMNGDKEVIIPGRVFESFIWEGAKKTKEGKICLSSTFVDNDPVFEYDGGPLSLDELRESEQHRLASLVKVGMSKIVRTRPYFENVKATFVVSLETGIANPTQLEQWVEAALNQVGLGDWRPRHGRGALVSFAAARSLVDVAA